MNFSSPCQSIIKFGHKCIGNVSAASPEVYQIFFAQCLSNYVSMT